MINGIQRRFNATTRYPDRPVKELTDATEKFFTQGITETDSRGVLDTKNLSERTYYILAAYKRYTSMSFNELPDDPDGTGRRPKPEVWGSLEDTHNAVHGNTGGGGHMSSIAVSAFDPIFWLHNW